METIIKKIQTALFTRNFNLSNDAERAQFLVDIHTHSRGIFNLSPVHVPVPNEAPLDIPRIILNSADNIHTCNISLLRTDIFYNIQGNEYNFDNLLETQKNNVQCIFSFFAKKGIIINRIGFVVMAEKILALEEGNSQEYIKSKFISRERMQDPKELMIRYNQNGRSSNFDMNNLISISSLFGISNKIAIQTDINTVQEITHTANFNFHDFLEIMEYVINKTKELINNFPNI